MSALRRTLLIDPQDSVLVALEAVAAGDRVMGPKGELLVHEAVGRGHKIAMKNFMVGDTLTKYGFPIGHASAPIATGAWVHLHNLKTGLAEEAPYHYQPLPPVTLPSNSEATFDGYLREDGGVGVRNELWILVTVGCVNKVAENLAMRANREFQDRNLDGVQFFTHPYGCSQLGEDELHTQKILAGLVRHPNAGGILIIGLGCENNNFKSFSKVLGPVDSRRVKFLQSQDVPDEMEAGMELLRQLADHAESFKRQPMPASKLILGMKCGGSDGFSGITANPLVGRIADHVCGAGGSALLTEVPEMFGAEPILFDRCSSAGVFQQAVDMVQNFKDYFRRYGQVIYENPSAGNKDGGISTLEEKSLGCVQKGGRSQVNSVVDYGGRLSAKGLSLVSAPGNDAVSVTALVAAGAQMVLFTTGRGTPFGGAVPTLKISTNSDLAARKPAWIDFNAGRLLENLEMSQAENELFALVLDCASGRIQAKNEKNGFREIAIFKDGVTM